MAVAAGADALGLVSAMPSGPGVIADDAIAAIAATVPPPVATVLLTSQRDAAAIVAQVRAAGVNTVQIVDHVAASVRHAMRRALPAVRVLQVVHVTGPESVAEAARQAEGAHALLLDSGDPAAAVPVLGGTGRTHDWSVSRQIVARSPVPVFLAGGLRAGNAAEAIAAVRPFGLDLCSGVRTDGALDADKLERFVAAARL